MSESPEKNVVALLEEHVELAIATVQKLRAEKLALEAEIARLTSDVLQRDAQIQELETRNSNLNEAYELEKLTAQEERAGIRQRLEELMAVLADTSEAGENDTSASVDEEAKEGIVFAPDEEAEENIVFKPRPVASVASAAESTESVKTEDTEA